MIVLVLDKSNFLICQNPAFIGKFQIAIPGMKYCACEIFDSKSSRSFSGLGKPAKINQG